MGPHEEHADPATPRSLDLTELGVPELGEVRRWTGAGLAGVGDEHLSDVLVVATELVTNAVNHGDGAVRITVARIADPCRVRVEVTDRAARRPLVREPSNTRTSGRGMILVAGLAERWGVYDQPGGKTVWAEVSCVGPGRAHCPPVTATTT